MYVCMCAVIYVMCYVLCLICQCVCMYVCMYVWGIPCKYIEYTHQYLT
jgi:hypothetical protein